MKCYKGDKSLAKTVSRDCADLRQVASLVRTEKLTEARTKARMLDTLVREVIPDDVWEWLVGC